MHDVHLDEAGATEACVAMVKYFSAYSFLYYPLDLVIHKHAAYYMQTCNAVLLLLLLLLLNNSNATDM